MRNQKGISLVVVPIAIIVISLITAKIAKEYTNDPDNMITEISQQVVANEINELGNEIQDEFTGDYRYRNGRH